MMRIDKPGLYDLSDEVYFADPCPEPSLSASTAKTLIAATPMHAADAHPRLTVAELPPVEDTPEDKFDIGKAAHALITGKGGEIETVDADSWRTKSAKEERDAIRERGNTPLLPEQADRVRLLVGRARTQLLDGVGYEPFGQIENNEQTLLWRAEGGIWCRCKPDALDYDNRIIWDLKTTDALADPQSWAETQIRATMIDLRAAHYLHGAARVLGPGWRYRFVPVEARRPHCLSIVELPGALIDLGEDKRHRAATTWGHCLASGRWQGWSGHPITIDEPAWLESRWLEKRDRKPTRAALEMASKMQAPH